MPAYQDLALTHQSTFPATLVRRALLTVLLPRAFLAFVSDGGVLPAFDHAVGVIENADTELPPKFLRRTLWAEATSRTA